MQDRATIAKAYRRSLEELRTHPPDDPARAHIRITSGTTGTPIIAIQRWAPFWTQRYAQNTTIASCYGQRSLRLFQALTAHDQDGSLVRRILCIDNEDCNADLAALLEDFAPDRIQGHVSFIARMLQHTHRSESVREVHAAGERISPTMEYVYRARLPHAQVHLDYITIETGAVGRSCPQQPLNVYHPEKNVQIDIDAPDQDGIGPILVSRTYNNVVFDRYNTGDLGRVIHSPCTCGNTFTFEHIGRAGLDHVKLCGVLIRQDEFDRVLKRYIHAYEDYRIDAREVSIGETIMGSIEIKLYNKAGPPSEALIMEMRQHVEKNTYLTPTLTLANLVAQNVFTPLSITYTSMPFKEKNKIHRFSSN